MNQGGVQVLSVYDNVKRMLECKAGFNARTEEETNRSKVKLVIIKTKVKIRRNRTILPVNGKALSIILIYYVLETCILKMHNILWCTREMHKLISKSTA